MRRKLHIAGKGRDNWIRISDGGGKVVCTLPHTEERMARFIVWTVNLFGFGLRPYGRQDWLREKNEWRPKPPAPMTGTGASNA